MQKNRLPLGTNELPEPLPLRKLLGPSFILLGLGLGSGEIILWPYLVSNHGMGVVWGMLIGITMQFFINMEVERYALVFGESIFVGFARLWRWFPVWFFLSTFLGFGWPGIGLTGATIVSKALAIPHANLISVIAFLAIGCILSLGTVLYKTVETLQKWLIGIGVPSILLLTLTLIRTSDLQALILGLAGKGEGYWFLPQGIVLGTFLGAVAYAGAGGNLNLAQSCYVRDKGYGMGTYADRITSVIRKRKSTFRLTGNTFPLTEENLSRFRIWWKRMNTEHLLVFWVLGLTTMLLLALLAHATVFNVHENAQGISFLLNEASVIGSKTLPIIGTLFLAITGIMLLATQLTVLDSTSRIMTENALLLMKPGAFNVSRVYFLILWLQIIAGIVVFSLGISQPRELITLGAMINAVAMFIYTGILLFCGQLLFPKPLRPRMWRLIVLLLSFLFLGALCGITFFAH
jgi:hypothetical protein